MKALSWALLAVGCYGALACALMSGVLGATWAGASAFNVWDYQGKLEWGRGVIAAAAAGWPWVLGFVACLGSPRCLAISTIFDKFIHHSAP